jgi:hypothetical protein
MFSFIQKFCNFKTFKSNALKKRLYGILVMKRKELTLMQAQAYVGYLEKGLFYTAGQLLQLPERRKLVITILDEAIDELPRAVASQPSRPDWLDELNRLLDDSAEEDLDAEIFCRTPMRRESVFFTQEELLV